MKNFKNGYYTADTQNGVTFQDEILEDSSVGIMSAKDFQETLSSLSESESIYAYFDERTEEILEEIHADFGVNA